MEGEVGHCSHGGPGDAGESMTFILLLFNKESRPVRTYTSQFTAQHNGLQFKSDKNFFMGRSPCPTSSSKHNRKEKKNQTPVAEPKLPISL
jgi:hypothetical protein